VLDGVEGLLASADTVCDALPRLPDVLPKLMKALRDERASWEEIAQVVGQDALVVLMDCGIVPKRVLTVEVHAVPHALQSPRVIVIRLLTFVPLPIFRSNPMVLD